MKETYITRAILKDYLTIKNVDITFNEGINIIIGKNGTGKTNFINYFKDSLQQLPQFQSNKSIVTFLSNGENFEKRVLISKSINVDLSLTEISDVLLFRDNEEIKDKKSILSTIIPTLIQHGVPENYDMAKNPFSGVIIKIDNGGYLSFHNLTKSTLVSSFGYNYITSILFKGKSKKDFDQFEYLNTLIGNLYKFSNIQKVRFGQNYDINDNDEDEIQFNNLYFEFLVSEEWLLFNQLSDGTKRLFYIISEITLSDRSIILLEEPELGLHPDYLYKLMQFIKESSEKFQFIITTHSPMVLNTLNSDELGNIIISKIENGETKLEHLSDEQIEKAKAYMEELDLSDYWIHSDLED